MTDPRLTAARILGATFGQDRAVARGWCACGQKPQNRSQSLPGASESILEMPATSDPETSFGIRACGWNQPRRTMGGRSDKQRFCLFWGFERDFGRKMTDINIKNDKMDSLFAQSEQLPAVSEHWCLTKDGDPYCHAMAQRHYSARRYREQRQRLFVGPGFKLVLLSKDGSAVFVWRNFNDAIQPPQTGYNCAIFRNEGNVLSSQLINEAVDVVFAHWGRQRCYTLVNPSRIRSSNPGCCFKKAGWQRCGICKTGKIIFELI